MNVRTVADLVSPVKPFVGQDLQIEYHVYTDLTLSADASISSWALIWTLFNAATDSAAVIIKTTASGISVASPIATVTVANTELAPLDPYLSYFMQLWRNNINNVYPLSGVSPFQLQPKPPLA